MILCFPDKIKKTKKYQAIFNTIQERKRKGQTLSYHSIRKLFVGAGIAPPTIRCNEKCPYYKDCHKENQEIIKKYASQK